jgi:hypothetical protein
MDGLHSSTTSTEVHLFYVLTFGPHITTLSTSVLTPHTSPLTADDAGVGLTALPLKPTTNSTKSFVVVRKGQVALPPWSLGPYASWGDGSALDTHPITGRVYAAVRYAAGNTVDGPVGTWLGSWTNEQFDRLV